MLLSGGSVGKIRRKGWLARPLTKFSGSRVSCPDFLLAAGAKKAALKFLDRFFHRHCIQSSGGAFDVRAHSAELGKTITAADSLAVVAEYLNGPKVPLGHGLAQLSEIIPAAFQKCRA